MPTLTPEGQRLIEELAQRHGFTENAVSHMLTAVIAGNGRMAQFAHPEFGGNGQWMSGGMLMLGDMFNNALKGRVTGLCSDLADALAAVGPLAAPAQSQSQHQGGNGELHLPDTPFFEPSASSAWWPDDLGTPVSTGSQNAMRYAWFADARRLVVDSHGDLRVYDTLDHRIGGFSQQQGRTDSISMSSQHGTIDLTSLPVVLRNGEVPAVAEPVSPSEHVPQESESQPEVVEQNPVAATAKVADPAFVTAQRATTLASIASVSSAPSEPVGNKPMDPLQLIERLGELHERGLLTDDEFTTKKQELLSRL